MTRLDTLVLWLAQAADGATSAAIGQWAAGQAWTPNAARNTLSRAVARGCVSAVTLERHSTGQPNRLYRLTPSGRLKAAALWLERTAS